MAGLEDIISNNAILRSIANTLGIKRDVYVPEEMPNSPASYRFEDREALKTEPLKFLPRSTIPTALPTSVPMYRADPTGKFGGTEGLETQPITRFTKGGDRTYPTESDIEKGNIYNNAPKAIQELYRYARINGAAEKHGLPAMTPEEIAAFALKEGRSDLGYNAFMGNPKEQKYQQELLEKYNIPFSEANFLSAVASKKRIADKFGIPFANAWNGVGVNVAGQSGKDYSKDWEKHLEAVKHEKNKTLMDLINQAVEDGRKYGFPLMENKIKDSIPRWEKKPFNKGGLIDKPLAGGRRDIF